MDNWNPQEHAIELLNCMERYCREEPTPGNQLALRHAKELVRLVQLEQPPEEEVENLIAGLNKRDQTVGSIWSDLEITAYNLRRKK